MLFGHEPSIADASRESLAAASAASESDMVENILKVARADAAAQARIKDTARRLVEEVRKRRRGHGGVDAFLHEFSLSSREGVVLMCLAEALLRIPDADTADRLIRDKLADADWARHLGQSDSLFVNASTWALMLTGRVIRLEGAEEEEGLATVLKRLVARSGEPVIRHAVTASMRILGRQFVMGRTIDEALARAMPSEPNGWRHSFDMLGEAARTAADAERYFRSYVAAIEAIGAAAKARGPIDGPGISVKLSALHPRYELAQAERVRKELGPRLIELARLARGFEIGFTVDAEEAERLDLSLDLIAATAGDVSLGSWEGFGLAIQAYQKRALPLAGWVSELARSRRRPLMVRLVKGAYWDTEIKRAQERGLDSYPVFTRKASTDVSYLACARALLAADHLIYPQFATHNAQTLAAVLEFAGNKRFEFQRLHGMGETLYEQIVSPSRPCRVYAPVGSHEDLLPYLVRRLLENGANTSFVNRLADDAAPIEAIVADPVVKIAALDSKPHPRIPLPTDLYLPERRNSTGLDLNDGATLLQLDLEMEEAALARPFAGPLIDGLKRPGRPPRAVLDPADRRRIVGQVADAGPAEVDAALTSARAAWRDWDAVPAGDRAAILDRAADLFEAHRAELMTLVVREAGRTVADALSEVREAVDFCRYYGARAREEFGQPQLLPGPTGGRNDLRLSGRGVFACISPWNFPLAIFTGQVVAALAAGNGVIAKPAEQTPLIAARAVALLHEAGVPGQALHMLPGDGPTVGARLVTDPRVAGVVFTGGTDTARAINRSLAERPGPIAALIAETGGLNAMIVDSSALAEQVVADALASAFNSAGQRCSALRVLFVQDDVARKLLDMLAGAMAELVIGDPARLATDVGPVIDDDAKSSLDAHARRMVREAKLIYECALPADCAHGTFFAPRAFEIDALARLEREVFGPILHVVRFSADRLDDIVRQINATGYGLTLGIHSRIDGTVERIRAAARVGNVYVNRNMIGAVVGVQPFGGEGLSGTGPKAGGPHYLPRFAVERSLAVDTTAQGGNASLLALDDEE
ncbi:MAG TPA: bifunctional proline dehydrogenase/L-glutamate gamma-semialdehyde dehydrogenase PutA [Alphaproteobacteria bacterium]|nr:bifunctional proline dehydrogenase/L-glutamate gamma-semialdehyde dehydrogenase PutA [Alphaproteobacteria bacterium]